MATTLVKVNKPGTQDHGVYKLYEDRTYCWTSEHEAFILGTLSQREIPLARLINGLAPDRFEDGIGGNVILFEGREYQAARGPNVFD